MVAAASILAIVGLVDVLRAFDARASHYASLSELDRVYGVLHSRDLWPPREVVEDALATMPEDARYRVVFGRTWRASRETKWKDEFTAGFLGYFLLPRSQTDSTSAPWVLCFACDASELGGRFHVLSQSEDDFRFGRIERTP